MDPKIIVIDGKTYHSVDEMPPDIRQKYEQAIRTLGDANGNRVPDAFEAANILADRDKNGVPDILENLAASNTVVNNMKIVVDGKEFNGIENLPPEARARYEEAMGKLDANRNGIPDFFEGMMNTANQTSNSSANASIQTPPPSRQLDQAAYASTSQSNPLPVSPTIAPDTSNGWMLALAGLFLLALCVVGAAGVWYFFLR
ncbi:MAG TPA: hypothetical protein VK206_11225 [Anaerolineales bacterium]|nr:hypothetical protein [Anaerolineales bacterium]HLO28977.1 hypothetical protein [Anaerolineales bacterium]